VDKLGFKDAEGTKFCSVERRIIAASTSYDIYSADGKQLVAKIEREWLSLTPKYQCARPSWSSNPRRSASLRAHQPCWPACTAVYYEGDDNPFGDFFAEGSFADRLYTFKKAGGFETIARVRRVEEAVRDVDTYSVEVAAGVDAAAIIAMAVVIDEDHDEEDAKRKREEEKSGGGWPFG
jgi:uncharacterized protein YxjI